MRHAGAAPLADALEGGAEARRESGLELRKRCRIKTAGALGHALEAVEQAAVAAHATTFLSEA